MVEDPTSQAPFVLIFLESVVHPQAERQRPSQGTAPQDGIVGRIGQGGFHLGKSQDTGRSLVFVHDLQLVDSGIESLPFRKILGGGASREKTTKQSYPPRSEGTRQ